MFGSNWVKSWTMLTARLIALAGIALLPLSAMAGTSVPSSVVTVETTVPATGLGIYQVNVALDACGNIYTIQSGSIYSGPSGYSAINGGQVSEIPAGGGAATTIVANDGVNYDSNALWIDATKSNLYITEGPYNVYKIPIVNCAPQTGSQSSISIGNLGPVSYYWSAGAVAADSAGDVFIATNADCCGSGNELVEESANGSTGTTLLINLSSYITSVAVDASNNLYYVAGGALFQLPYNSGTKAYATTPVSYGSGYSSNVVGVALDSSGNLYVSDGGNSIVYEIPNETNGSTTALNPNDQFVVVSGAAITGPVAIDPSGNLFYTNDNYNGPVIYTGSSTYIYEATRGNANLRSVALGSTATATLNVFFNASVTPATIGIVTPTGVFSSAAGGTCAAAHSYAAGDTCTVNVGFAPALPGVAIGAVVLADSTGAVVSATTLYGIGLGAEFTADPGTTTSFGSGLKTPTSVALDAAGDVFIADSGSSTVWEFAAGTTTPVAIGSGLSAPTGVAVDGAGNVFIADTGNNQIVEVPVVNGALSTTAQITVIASGVSVTGSALSSPGAVSVDPSGNLYIADTGNKRVLFLPRSDNWNIDSAYTLGSGWSSPSAIAVSAIGQIYVADSGSGKVFSLPYPGVSAPQTTAVTGLNGPSSLAVDPGGNLFVVEKGNSVILRIPNISGTLASASALNITDGIASPYGLALDPTGNLYVTDSANATAWWIPRTSATLAFGQTNPGTIANPVTVLVEDSGNQALTLGTPDYTATGDTSAFPLTTSEKSACASGATIAVGSSCSLEANFAPTAYQAYSETLAFTTNAKNTSAPQVIFTGTGAATLATTTAFSIASPSGSPHYGEAIQISATVTSSTGTPTGTVALLVDGFQATTATLSNGAASLSLPSGLAGGNHTLQVSYAGVQAGFIYYSAGLSAVQNIAVTRVSTTTVLSVTTQYVSPASQPAGNAVTLTAIVSSSYTGIPSGSVTFVIKDPAAGTVTQTVALAASNGGLQATTTYTPIASVSGKAYDTVTVTATYTGDTDFLSSESQADSFDVSPVGGSVVLGSSGSGLTSSKTTQSVLTFTATSYGGWQGVVGYQCVASSLPANAICVFSPGQLLVSASTPTSPYPPFTTELKVVVNNPPNSPAQSSLPWWLAGILGMGLLIMRRRLVRSGAWAALVWLIAAAASFTAVSALSGCSNGVSFLTPTGTSTVTVVASSDPYTSGSTTTTQACGINASGSPDPSVAPCSQQTFQVSLVVQ